MKFINGLRAERMQQMTMATAAAALDSVPVQTDISACGARARAGKSLVFISRTDGQKCARIDRGGDGAAVAALFSVIILSRLQGFDWTEHNSAGKGGNSLSAGRKRGLICV